MRVKRGEKAFSRKTFPPAVGETGTLTLTSVSAPPFSSLSDTMIMDSIAAFLVLPNRLLVPLVPDLQDVAQLRSPLPRVWPSPLDRAFTQEPCGGSLISCNLIPPLQGIVRIHLLAARGLSSKDKYVKGLIEGKSDPYALVRVGTQAFCSRVINEELNPQWGETYEVGVGGPAQVGKFQEVLRADADWMLLICRPLSLCILQVMVHEVPGQEIEVEVFDKDPDKDDFLGR